MLVYFMEQVWSVEQEWSRLRGEVHDICALYWHMYNYDHPHLVSYMSSPYIEMGVDFVEF